MTEFTKPGHFRATVLTKEKLTEKVYIIRYGLVQPTVLNFVAGQTIMIKITQGVNRAMSIASAPQENTVITSIQDVSPGGPGSKWMENLKTGDSLEFTGPLGRFVIDRVSPRKRILVATGTGIAPFRSMLLDSSDVFSGQKDFALYWGLRYEADVYLQEELRDMEKTRDGFRYYLTLSRPSDTWEGLKGHVTDYVFANEKDLTGCDFYLCGNKKMITEMQQRLTESGVAKEQMKFDPFY